MSARQIGIIGLCVVSYCFPNLSSQEVVVRTSDGGTITLEVGLDDTVGDMLKKAALHQGPLVIEMSGSLKDLREEDTFYTQRPRIYYEMVTPEEKEDVRYILKSMATKSWTELLGSRSSLNRAGDRIDHIHPLRFLYTIFSDEQMRGCLHSIRFSDRKQIWKSFFTGLEESLEEESQKNNMTLEFIHDFAKLLKINVASVHDLIKNRQWPELVDALLKLLPRTGDPGRYDM